MHTCTVGKIKNRTNGSVCGVGQACAASLPTSLWNRCKGISDVNAEIEAAAERTKRMRYQRGFQSPRLLFNTDALEDFYSQTYRCSRVLTAPGGTPSGREQETESHLWGEMRKMGFFCKCRYEFLKVAYYTSLISPCCGEVCFELKPNDWLVQDFSSRTKWSQLDFLMSTECANKSGQIETHNNSVATGSSRGLEGLRQPCKHERCK